MDTHSYVSVTNASIPALVSTAITISYILLRLIQFIANATTREAETGKDKAETRLPQPECCPTTGAESRVEIHQRIQEGIYTTTRDVGEYPRHPEGTSVLRKRWTDVCLPTPGDTSTNTKESVLRANDERLQSRGSNTAQGRIESGPEDTYYVSTRISTESGSRTNASHAQS